LFYRRNSAAFKTVGQPVGWIAAGPRQHSNWWFFVSRDSW
jgi:hypothetical protein